MEGFGLQRVILNEADKLPAHHSHTTIQHCKVITLAIIIDTEILGKSTAQVPDKIPGQGHLLSPVSIRREDHGSWPGMLFVLAIGKILPKLHSPPHQSTAERSRKGESPYEKCGRLENFLLFPTKCPG
ncbi:hypothetical protein BTVI_100513 [Pitangus sulphuratus]|nr:hypothetical protein BTVI_100513 [Pitangus sulphuratus]